MNSLAAIPQTMQTLIIGSLLGDGCLSLAPGKQSASLEITHSLAEMDYLQWKYAVLKDICNHAPALRAADGTFSSQPRYRLRTQHLPEFCPLRDLFYPAGRRVITPEILTLLTPAALAVWYMDDGHYNAKQHGVRFCTHRYTLQEVEAAIAWFDGMGMIGKLNRCTGRQEGQFMIRLGKKQLDRLFGLIAPFMHPSMARKAPQGMTLGGEL